jgi:hypothetical protein
LLKEKTTLIKFINEDIEMLLPKNNEDAKKPQGKEGEEEVVKLLDRKLCDVLQSFNIKEADFEKKEKEKEEKVGKLITDNNKPAVIIDGYCMGIILGNNRLTNLFLHITDLCGGVVCCRISPLHKVFVLCVCVCVAVCLISSLCVCCRIFPFHKVFVLCVCVCIAVCLISSLYIKILFTIKYLLFIRYSFSVFVSPYVCLSSLYVLMFGCVYLLILLFVIVVNNKALIVRMVKRRRSVCTLAIGDGANGLLYIYLFFFIFLD